MNFAGPISVLTILLCAGVSACGGPEHPNECVAASARCAQSSDCLKVYDQCFMATDETSDRSVYCAADGACVSLDISPCTDVETADTVTRCIHGAQSCSYLTGMCGTSEVVSAGSLGCASTDDCGGGSCLGMSIMRFRSRGLKGEPPLNTIYDACYGTCDLVSDNGLPRPIFPDTIAPPLSDLGSPCTPGAQVIVQAAP